MECHNCGHDFEVISHHWRQSKCDYPRLSEKQKEISIGFLMSDGYLDTRNTPHMRTIMKNKKYLEHMENEFGCISGDITLYKTAEEMAEMQRNNGQNDNAKAENYNDYWNWSTKSIPDFSQFESWYSSGEKVWPDDIELTPLVLKHLYCGDGTLTESNQIRISMMNERDRLNNVERMFRREKLPEPIRFDKDETNVNAVFTVEDSKILFDYMGEALPGFEYKWI